MRYGESMIAVQVSIAIIAFLMLELAVLYLVNRKHFSGKFGRGEAGAEDEVKLIAGRGLTLVGFTGATLAFLLGQVPNHSELGEPIFLIGLALILFLTTFKLDILGATWRAIFEAQSRCFGYGLVALTAGLALAYGSLSSSFSSIALILPAVAVGWQIVEFLSDARIYYRLRKGHPSIP